MLQSFFGVIRDPSDTFGVVTDISHLGSIPFPLVTNTTPKAVCWCESLKRCLRQSLVVL